MWVWRERCGREACWLSGGGEEGWVPPDVEVERRELPGLEWGWVDVREGGQRRELVEFLNAHYVRGEAYRLEYEEELVEHALTPPGYRREWHVVLREKKKGRIMATITAVPREMREKGGRVVVMAVINFLCVHQRLREKRLAPVLIREITRKIDKAGVMCALYTSGTRLNKKVVGTKYVHWPIDTRHLENVGFMTSEKKKRKMRSNLELLVPETNKQIEDLWNQYRNCMETVDPDMAVCYTLGQFKQMITGNDTFMTKDARNFVSFFYITQKAANHDIRAAYVMHILAQDMHQDTILMATLDRLPSHLINALHNQIKHTTHFHTSNATLFHYTYNHKHTPLHHAPFALP